MALEKADIIDSRQQYCEHEAKEIIFDWFKENTASIQYGSIRTIWFAFLPTGYRIMMNSSQYDNLFFEIIRNIKTDEYTIHCFERFEYIVHPNHEEPIIIKSRPQKFIKTSSRKENIPYNRRNNTNRNGGLL